MTKVLRKKQKGLNRHWKNYQDKDYLGSHNLEEGEEMLLTIAKFEGEEMVQKPEGAKEAMMVLYFNEDVPKMILNVTNATTVGNLYGLHPENWIGKQIQIYSVTGKFFGKLQQALRIRDFIPKISVDVSVWQTKLEAARTLAELKTIWASFPVSVRNDPIMISIKDSLKATLS